MDRPEVSVIIPSFNRAAMLAEAVESVLGQSCRSFELIVVDDASTDGTAGLLRAWQGALIALRNDRRRGVSASRNLGASRAGGRWLAFLDSDDLWLPDKLALQLEAHRSQPRMLVSHTDEIWIRNGVRVNPMNKHAKRGGRIFDYNLPMCRISPSAVMIDRNLFFELGAFDERFRVCEDYDLWLRVSSRCPVLYVDRQLVIKRGGHADQLSASHWGFDRWRVRAIVKILASGSLTPSQRVPALRELSAKAAILRQGYARRGKRLQAARYARLGQWAACQLDRLVAGTGV